MGKLQLLIFIVHYKFYRN